MQELFGRLAALDSEATQSLKVIAYFDELVAGDVGVETLTRGAALLSGTTAGAIVGARQVRVAPDGKRADAKVDATQWSFRSLDEQTYVWIERQDAPHANDAMILERFALALSVLQARRRTVSDHLVKTVLDGELSEDRRLAAASRLRLDAGIWQVVATEPESVGRGIHDLIPTPHGMVRAHIVPAGNREAVRPVTGGVAGIGTAGPSNWLAESWAEAELALRLTTPENPVIEAADLGVIFQAVQKVEEASSHNGRPHPDVRMLLQMETDRRRILAAIVAHTSIRSAAATLGLHHSTVQTHHDSFTRELGYDPRSATGRARYEVAALLARLQKGRYPAQVL